MIKSSQKVKIKTSFHLTFFRLRREYLFNHLGFAIDWQTGFLAYTQNSSSSLHNFLTSLFAVANSHFFSRTCECWKEGEREFKRKILTFKFIRVT
jgi:ABC-type uncharacterized transport system permease subunit